MHEEFDDRSRLQLRQDPMKHGNLVPRGPTVVETEVTPSAGTTRPSAHTIPKANMINKFGYWRACHHLHLVSKVKKPLGNIPIRLPWLPKARRRTIIVDKAGKLKNLSYPKRACSSHANSGWVRNLAVSTAILAHTPAAFSAPEAIAEQQSPKPQK